MGAQALPCWVHRAYWGGGSADSVDSLSCQLPEGATSCTPSAQCTLAQEGAEGGVEDRQPPAGRRCSATRDPGPLPAVSGGSTCRAQPRGSAPSSSWMLATVAGLAVRPACVPVRVCASACVRSWQQECAKPTVPGAAGLLRAAPVTVPGGALTERPSPLHPLDWARKSVTGPSVGLRRALRGFSCPASCTATWRTSR